MAGKTLSNKKKRVEGSFRDPSGHVFIDGAKVYRQINNLYAKTYESIRDSGLYDELIEAGLLIPHKELSESEAKKVAHQNDYYKILKADTVQNISYPYEWSFSQLKDAALTTLEIQRRCLERGFSLKDASAYNIQFHKGKPVFIDTLSFEPYIAGKPWVAYKQYCQHFLAPLALMSKTDVNLLKLMRDFIDGIPLDLTSRILPVATKLTPGLGIHIHAHARSQMKHSRDADSSKVNKAKLSQRALQGVITSLANTTAKLTWKPKGTEWGDYYTFTNYSDKSFNEKKKIIKSYVEKVRPKKVWDVGANNGLFSRIASTEGINTIAFDIDPIAVEKNYRQVVLEGEETILPLVMDLTNPSPSLGWSNKERDSMIERGPADMVFSLALIHHLAISNNLPLEKIAEYFASIAKNLVIEFVPKGDSQVDILLATREDIFPDYNEDGFEDAFKEYFKIISKDKVEGSKRILYLMKR